MARTSEAIDAVGALVREPLISPPNVHRSRVVAPLPGQNGTFAAYAPTPGSIEIQLTVKLSDVVAALSSAEAAAGDSLGVLFAVGFTDDAGALINAGDVPAYLEAIALRRSNPTDNHMRAFRNAVAGVALTTTPA